MVLKPSMVIPAEKAPRQAGVDEVAEATLRCLRRTVPAAVPGVAFLSGGQGAELATEHLNAMNAIGGAPWQLIFSYGRALQDPALMAWRGHAANLVAGRQALHKRSRCNSAACSADYSAAMEATQVVTPAR
jgi:fructose-bisphosphate aldolase class I